MNSSTESKLDQQLWVAVHLLYPNSSQALDVYHTLMQSVSQKNDSERLKLIYEKLENFFLKNATVRSANPFRVFEDYSLKYWNSIYKKSQKHHLLVIIGLTVFGFSINQISQIVKVPAEKIRFLINQSFKKLADGEIRSPELQVGFKFKKKSEQKVSYFFTNEYLVEYCLKLLPPRETELVAEGLTQYPQLAKLKKIYSEAIQEIHELCSRNDYVIESHPFMNESTNEVPSVEIPRLQFSKKTAAVAALSLGFVLLVTFRPFSFEKLSFRTGPTSLKIQEVTSQPRISEEPTTVPVNQVSLNEMPVEVKAKLAGKAADSKNLEAMPATKPTASDQIAKPSVPIQVAEAKPKPVAAPPQPPQTAKAKQNGGLYRGVLYVSDLDASTQRITEKFVSLGGKKAGEVELGWRKSKNLSYYHLTIPDEGFDQAKVFLKNFGNLNIQFETHPRALPPGTKRMILEVKESE